MSLVDLLPSDARLKSVPAGELIFAQGDRGDIMYVIAEGEAQILIDGKPLETVGAGGILGEMALIDAEPRSATVITKLPARAGRRAQLHRSGHTPAGIRAPGHAGPRASAAPGRPRALTAGAVAL